MAGQPESGAGEGGVSGEPGEQSLALSGPAASVGKQDRGRGSGSVPPPSLGFFLNGCEAFLDPFL